MKEISLSCLSLTKKYADTTALADLSLDVCEGEILALVGPSGCGKTTLLRMIAGFETPSQGEIRLAGEVVSRPGESIPPERRGVGMVFQDYALFPHLTVLDNVAFGLRSGSNAERQARAEEMLALTGLTGYDNRYPHELSGGERQRVALARALAPRPRVVLLDEPFSNLDAERRRQVRGEVRAILKQLGATAVFVTHDQEEALYIGDRLAVLNQGRVEQLDCPEVVFHHPATRFVAEFMGETDFLGGEVVEAGIETEIGFLSQPVGLPLGVQVEVAVRADDINFRLDPRGAGVIEDRYFLGALNRYRVRLPSGQVLHSYQPHTDLHRIGAQVTVFPDANHALALFYQGKAVLQ
jgi:iron(III) transport system ATP-binding protein